MRISDKIKKSILAVFSIVLLLPVQAKTKSKDQYLIAGCGFDKVAIINREGKILWSYPLEKPDCNDAQITRKGNILMAYTQGAKLIGKDHTVLWDYKVTPRKEEMFTAQELKNGDFLIACCGKPARIMELSPEGKVKKEILFETNIPNVHRQFRQITKTRKGTYLIGLFHTGKVIELNDKGEILTEITVGGTPFQVEELNTGNWLVTCGDGHSLVEVNPKTKKEVFRLKENDLPFCRLQFVAETTRLKNGNLLIANWNGHDRDKVPPILLEITKNNECVWFLEECPTLKRISTISVVPSKYRIK